MQPENPSKFVQCVFKDAKLLHDPERDYVDKCAEGTARKHECSNPVTVSEASSTKRKGDSTKHRDQECARSSHRSQDALEEALEALQPKHRPSEQELRQIEEWVEIRFMSHKAPPNCGESILQSALNVLLLNSRLSSVNRNPSPK